MRFGTLGVAAPASAEELARLRVERARRNEAWTEIPDDLVPRPRGRLVSASTDRVYRRYAGATFVGASLEFDANRPLSFVVRDGDVLVLEELEQTWSELFAERVKPQPTPKRRRLMRVLR